MAQPDAADALDSATMATQFASMVTGGWMSQAMYVAAELKVADLLASGPKTSEELARTTNVHAPSLRRLMRTLVTFEILRERADGSFELMPMGTFLRSDADHSLRSWAILCGRRLSRDWVGLLDSVKTGESASKLVTGRSFFEDLERDPREAAVFNQAIAELTRLSADGVAQAYDFSGMKRVVDVGGGYGQLLAAILKANPTVQGVVFDLPQATEKGRLYFQEIGLADRCEFVSGSFFESVPSGADAYVLKSVIHNWNDERARVILQRCSQAMAGRGKLMLVERIVPQRLQPSAAHRAIALMDLNMLVVLGARERMEDEYRALLSSAGLRLTRIIPAVLNFSIIEATPS
jgi:orsellinic acid C2-O-methyltransferase